VASSNAQEDLLGLLNRNDADGLQPDAGAHRDGTLVNQ
jgi:hypothetical protein